MHISKKIAELNRKPREGRVKRSKGHDDGKNPTPTIDKEVHLRGMVRLVLIT